MNDNVSKVPKLTPGQIAANQRFQAQLKAAKAQSVTIPSQHAYVWKVVEDLGRAAATLPKTHPVSKKLRKQMTEWLESIAEYDAAAKIAPEESEKKRLRAKAKFSKPCGCPLFENGPGGLQQIIYREKTLPGSYILACSRCGIRWRTTFLPKELSNLSDHRAKAVSSGREQALSAAELVNKILRT